MQNLPRKLVPPKTKPNSSVVPVLDDWYPVCRVRRLKRKPLSVMVMGIPMALYRDSSGAPVAVLDRCPHRNVPLSLGKVVQGELECAYHGWRFGSGGRCTAVPGLVGEAAQKGRNATAFPSKEHQGYVWVYPDAENAPVREPFVFPHLGEKGYTSVRYQMVVQGSMHAAAENALDVPHTAFLHGGLFRKPKQNPNQLEIIVRRWGDRVEAEYVGEPRPPGIMGKILAPGGGEVVHFDRFLLPCVTQVEYRLGEKSHLVVTTAMTPVSDFVTEMFAIVSFRLPIPHFLIMPFLRPIAIKVLKQDAMMLREQTQLIENFGGEQYVSTELDVIGPQIMRLLLQASRGERPTDEAPSERRSKIAL